MCLMSDDDLKLQVSPISTLLSKNNETSYVMYESITGRVFETAAGVQQGPGFLQAAETRASESD